MDLLQKYAAEVRIELTNEEVKKLYRYKELLLQWNERINLTAITDEEGIFIKHFIDSIIPANMFKNNSTLIDIGSGAGFPAVPISIINPSLCITALDSLKKRLNFLQDVKDNLNIEKLDFIHGRAEDYGRDKSHRETYDYATARAVASLNILSELCLPFVRVGGLFIAYKGDKWREEIKDSSNVIKKLGGEIIESKQYYLPHINDKRSIIIIKKVGKTPKEYPRKAGIPNKKPLT